MNLPETCSKSGNHYFKYTEALKKAIPLHGRLLRALNIIRFRSETLN